MLNKISIKSRINKTIKILVILKTFLKIKLLKHVNKHKILILNMNKWKLITNKKIIFKIMIFQNKTCFKINN